MADEGEAELTRTVVVHLQPEGVAAADGREHFPAVDFAPEAPG